MQSAAPTTVMTAALSTGNNLARRTARVVLSLSAALLTACASNPPPSTPARTPDQARALIARLLPRDVSDRKGWAADIYAGFSSQDLEPTPERVCGVIAVTEQESGFRTNPVIPGLGSMAKREIDERAGHAGVPLMIVHGALALKSSTGRSYSDRIESARTEKDLSDVFEDFIGSVPLGRTLFASWNPVRTRGPMQVSVAFAESYAATKPYPYPLKTNLPDELFTRRGSLYFGIAHLFEYQAPYDSYLYRFADFNAGQYASRNAAFQNAVTVASGIPVVPDGALLPHDGKSSDAGSTELALRTLAGRLDLSEGAIHDALEQGKTREFENTKLYRRVLALAERRQGRPPAALVPRIKLQGPKISRSLTTDWYAHRVEGRYKSCLAK